MWVYKRGNQGAGRGMGHGERGDLDFSWQTCLGREAHRKFN